MGIHLPGAEDWVEIAETLKLDRSKADVLWRAVEQIVGEIQQHGAAMQQLGRGRNRKEQIFYVRRLTSLFAKLERHLAERDSNTDRILRNVIGVELGRLLSHESIERLTGESPGYDVSIHFWESHAANERAGPYRALEAEMEGRRRAVGMQTAPRLFLNLVRALNAPLLRFLEMERQARGGAPGKRYRNHAIVRLVPVYSKIWGRRPTSAPNGRFVTLCELVLVAIGLDTDGTDQAVQRILRRLKAG